MSLFVGRRRRLKEDRFAFDGLFKRGFIGSSAWGKENFAG